MRSAILKTTALLAFWSCFLLIPERFPIGNNLAFAAVTNVPAGGNLQTAIDRAQPGDTITLEPGATYKGQFRLRKKAGDQFITITTSSPEALPPANTRITPAAAANLPKLVASSNVGVIGADPGAHHYRFIGLEIFSGASQYSDNLILLGDGDETKLADLPTDIELDRLYIHGSATKGSKRGVALNGMSMVVKNCYISDMKSNYQDSQAIGGWNGPGPFQIINNYLEASGENILFGGAPAVINGVVPSDILIKRNHFYKQPSWFKGHPTFGGTIWMVKNLLELKAARRVTIEGNIFENCWGQAQAGYAIVFTVRAVGGSMPWVVVEDVDFVRNIVRESSGGVNILGRDYNSDNLGIARRILIKDNIFENIDYTRWGGEGRMYQVLEGAEDVTVDHNTHITNNLRHLIMLEGIPLVRFVWTNNVAPDSRSGVMGSGKGEGTASLNYYAPGYTFRKNVLVGAKATAYPATNFFPTSVSEIGFVNKAAGDYRLSENSPYKDIGTDGKDLGANIPAVRAATAGVDSRNPSVGDAPKTVSVSPASGDGLSQTFDAQYSDADGVDDLRYVYLLFNSSQEQSKACSILYKRAENTLWLRDNDGADWQGPASLGKAGNLSNGQCAVNAGTAQVTTSGQSLTLSVPITFQSSFVGARTIYLNAEDKDGLISGWKNHGTWTPAPNADPVVSITAPANNAAFTCPATVSFQATVTDAEGESLDPVWTDNGTTLSTGATISRRFDCTQSGTHTIIATATDSYGASGSQTIRINIRAKTDPVVEITAPQNGASFKCPVTVPFQATAVDGDGLALVAQWTDNGSSIGSGSPLGRRYSCADAGDHVIVATATDGDGASGSKSITITIRPNAAPSVAITTPSNGAAFVCPATVTYRSTVTDPEGEQVVPSWTDNGVPIGTGATISRTYNCGQAGTHNVEATATDSGGASGTAAVGIAIQLNSAPTADSVSPSSGGGVSQDFQLLYSDLNGFDQIQQVVALFSTAPSVQAGACLIRYLPATAEVFLGDDLGTGWLTGRLTPGTAGSLQNKQCRLDTGTSNVTGTGPTLSLTLSLSFKSSFMGPKSIFMNVTDQLGATSNWQNRGTWNGRNTAPTADYVTPSSGGGMSQVFQFSFSDQDGFDNVQQVQALFSTSASTLAGACLVRYMPATNEIALGDDTGTTWLVGRLTPGIAGSLQNRQCKLDTGGSSFAGSGTALTLNLSLTFKSSFLGWKSILMQAIDTAGATSNWQARGSWTVR